MILTFLHSNHEPFGKLRMTPGEMNHEVWVVCTVCGEEYDARLEVCGCGGTIKR